MNLNFTLVLQVISFLILLGLLTRFLYKPLLGYLDERAGNIRKLIEGAEKDRKKAETDRKASQEELRRTKEEVLALKESTTGEADKEKIKTIDEAKKQALAIIEKAELEVKREITRTKDEAKKDLATLSVEIARKILGREVKEADHKKVIKEALKGISSERRT